MHAAGWVLFPACHAAWLNSCSVPLFCCQWDCICDKPTNLFLIVLLMRPKWDFFLNEDHQIGLLSELCQSNKRSWKQLEVALEAGGEGWG